MTEEATTTETARPARGRGFHHRPEKYHRLGAPHPTVGAKPAPAAGSIRAQKRLRLAQGRTESCGGHGTSTGVAATIRALAARVAAGTLTVSQAKAAALVAYASLEPSPRLVYADTRTIEQPGDGPLDDNGIDPVDLTAALGANGVEDWSRLPDGSVALSPDGRTSDIWSAEDVAHIAGAPPPNVGLRPTAEDDRATRLYPLDVSGVQLIDPTAEDFEDHFCDAIGNDEVAVGVGLASKGTWEAWGDSWTPGKAPLDDVSPLASLADHWVVCLEYRTVTNAEATEWSLPQGTRLFRIDNSWGDWGDDGSIWMTGRCLRARCAVALKFAVLPKVA